MRWENSAWSLQQQYSATGRWTWPASTGSPPRRCATTSATGSCRPPLGPRAATAPTPPRTSSRCAPISRSSPRTATPPPGRVMRAVHCGDLDAALTVIDRSHLQRHRDRETLAAVEVAVGALDGAPTADGPGRPLVIGHLAHRLGVSPRPCASGNGQASSPPAATPAPASGSTTQPTSATRSSPTCSAAVATCSATSPPSSARCAAPAAPNPSPPRSTTGGNGSPPAACSHSPQQRGSPITSTTPRQRVRDTAGYHVSSVIRS